MMARQKTKIYEVCVQNEDELNNVVNGFGRKALPEVKRVVKSTRNERSKETKPHISLFDH
jgi:hypothetical protein